MNAVSTPTARVGQAWFGGSTRLLVVSALVAGLAGSSLTGALLVSAHDPTHALATFVIAALGIWPLFAVVAWLLLVDTRTIRTPDDLSEDSVETQWSLEAGYHALIAVIVLCLAGALVFFLTEASVPGSLVLVAVALVGAAIFGLHYLRLQRTVG